jgi:diguanylate cyclase (GGDEF)-like protein
LPFWSKKTLRSFLFPGAPVLLAATILANSHWLTLPLPALTFLFYCALLGGMLLAWRFHSSRAFYCLLILFLADQVVPALGPSQHLISLGLIPALHAVVFLVPINYALVALMEERGLTLATFTPVGLFLFVESVIVAVLWQSGGASFATNLHSRHPPLLDLFPKYAAVAFIASAAVIAARFVFTRKAVDSSILWSMIAFALSIRSIAATSVSELYVTTAACILLFSIVENSYFLAYYDDLTSLPSRRAFNEATLQLRAPYCLAVVDIDHFKGFNDTYGHDVGDQVLRLVAGKLAGVTGGGNAYRCGGEEFNVLFPGKTLSEVVEHLERLRVRVESAEFKMRGQDRRQVPRGPDRRKKKSAEERKNPKYPRPTAVKEAGRNSLSVTVSVGVAACESNEHSPEFVLQSADKALYRAKANGRNRMEVASKSRAKAIAADIA